MNSFFPKKTLAEKIFLSIFILLTILLIYFPLSIRHLTQTAWLDETVMLKHLASSTWYKLLIPGYIEYYGGGQAWTLFILKVLGYGTNNSLILNYIFNSVFTILLAYHLYISHKEKVFNSINTLLILGILLLSIPHHIFFLQQKHYFFEYMLVFNYLVFFLRGKTVQIPSIFYVFSIFISIPLTIIIGASLLITVTSNLKKNAYSLILLISGALFYYFILNYYNPERIKFMNDFWSNNSKGFIGINIEGFNILEIFSNKLAYLINYFSNLFSLNIEIAFILCLCTLALLVIHNKRFLFLFLSTYISVIIFSLLKLYPFPLSFDSHFLNMRVVFFLTPLFLVFVTSLSSIPNKFLQTVMILITIWGAFNINFNLKRQKLNIINIYKSINTSIRIAKNHPNIALCFLDYYEIPIKYHINSRRSYMLNLPESFENFKFKEDKCLLYTSKKKFIEFHKISKFFKVKEIANEEDIKVFMLSNL